MRATRRVEVHVATKNNTWKWSTRVAARLGLYVLALVLLAFCASWHLYPLVIAGSAAVAGAAVFVHRGLAVKPQASPPPIGKRIAVLLLIAEVGVIVVALSHFQVFSAGGFAGASFVSFGIGQLVAEMREANWLSRTIAAFSAVNALGLVVVFAALGAGGWPVLILALVFAYPALSFGSEVAVDWTSSDKMRAKIDTYFRWICGALVVIAALALVSLYSIGGFVFLLLLGAVVFVLVGGISSNTDADWIFALIAIAVVVSQLPRSDPPRHVPDGSAQSIVAFGDSYISGEGATHYYGGTNTANPKTYDKCRRARTAWAPRVAKQQKRDLEFYACSGATVHNLITAGQYVGENPEGLRTPVAGKPRHFLSQIELYEANQPSVAPDWAFVSIGGNDAGFGDLINACITPGDCTEIGQQFLNRLDALPQLLNKAYVQLSEHFKGHVVVVPYPVPLREADCGIFDSTFTQQEQKFLYRFTVELDATIERQAARSHVLFVKDMPDAFVADHLRICDRSAGSVGVNVFALNPVEGPIDPREWVHNSMHPTATGHDAMAKVINQWIQDSATARPESAAALPAPKRDIERLMEGEVHSATPREKIDRWKVAAMHKALRHRFGLVVLVIAAWGLWVLVLRARRLHTTHKPLPEYLRARSLETRLVALVALIVAAAAVLKVAGWLSAFPAGYGGAQSRAACRLPTDADALADLRAGTTSDLFAFIPIYVVVALGAVVVTSRNKFRDVFKWQWPRRAVLWDGLAVLAVLLLGITDYVETLRFRHAILYLSRDNAVCRTMSGYTHLTRWFTWIKLALVLVVVGLIILRVLLPPAKRETYEELQTSAT